MKPDLLKRLNKVQIVFTIEDRAGMRSSGSYDHEFYPPPQGKVFMTASDVAAHLGNEEYERNARVVAYALVDIDSFPHEDFRRSADRDAAHRLNCMIDAQVMNQQVHSPLLLRIARKAIAKFAPLFQ